MLGLGEHACPGCAREGMAPGVGARSFLKEMVGDSSGPAGAVMGVSPPFHGFRCASPVATCLGPSGAKMFAALIRDAPYWDCCVRDAPYLLA